MDLKDIERYLEEKSGLARFVAIPSTMRRVRDHSDLESLRKAGVGFIVNVRRGDAKIHRVNCEAVEVMSTSEHPKIFGEAVNDVVEWVRTDRLGAYDNCGVCGGVGRLPTQN